MIGLGLIVIAMTKKDLRLNAKTDDDRDDDDDYDHNTYNNDDYDDDDYDDDDADYDDDKKGPQVEC